MLDSPVVRGTTVVYPGLEYKRSGYHNFWWGKHYRKEWATAVRVKNFYLDSAKGGLTVVKEGGSRQSMGLRLKDKREKEYVLRSIDKDFRNGLPEMFHKTFMGHILKDQSSIGYPFAAITITPMIEATGIYHTTPQVVFVPEQASLGEFNKKFGNQLYLFEERPDANQEDAANFGNSKNVIGTDKVFEKIYEDNDNRIDQRAFAKARLFDMFVGDWGRHADQWRWAKFEEGDKNIYRPIPRDRDQAYTRFDGFHPWVATNLFGGTQLESFDHHLHNAKRFNTPGRPLDRQFTNELSKKEWINIAKELQTELTDAIIESGMHQLPPELFAIRGELIISKLKSRRNDLAKYAEEYYNFLSHHVDLAGSQKREFFEIKRINKEETEINIYKITKDGEIKSKPYYSRLFRDNETKEIRIYSLESSDIFKVTGDSKAGVKVRIVDPERDDSLILSKNHFNKLSRGQRFEFDTFHQKKFDFSIRPLLSPPDFKIFDRDPLELFTRTGLRVNASFRYNTQPWRKPEYENEHIIGVNYGFLRKAFNIAYVGRLGRFVGKWDGLLKARLDIPAIENFYGIGNNTVNAKISAPYNATSSKRFYGSGGLVRNIGRTHHTEFSIFYQSVKVDKTPGHILADVPADTDQSVFSAKQFAGVEAGYSFDNSNSNYYPTKGIHFSIGGGYVQNMKDMSRGFFKASSSVSLYVPLSNSFSFAVRAGGATLTGEADYYHLNTLGGNENLRGYQRERFFGKNTFYNNNELRWMTDTRNYLFAGKIGLLAFYDIGRVWQPGEVSKLWHSGYGGGLTIMPFERAALTGTYGISKEGYHILFQTQFFF
ncbi:MAG: BamA/TamA family outer membrane protein [Chitinophagales bacterium]